MNNNIITDIPLKDFVEAINKNIRSGNNMWVDEALKKFLIGDDRVILKQNINTRNICSIHEERIKNDDS